MARRFDRFLDELARVALSPRACNQYARGVPENAVRRRNLRLYFEQLDAIGPRLMLVGEAVSYRGGRLTGIPFVSESLMLCGAGGILGECNGFRRATTTPRPSTEASATMVWATIRHIEPLPLLWNAFPFHPYAEGSRRGSASSRGCCGFSRSSASPRSATPPRRRSRSSASST